jgi:type IV pilus assembly protein PilA
MDAKLANARDRNGFTLIEMMVVLAVAAILALMAVPSYYYRVIRQQIEGMGPLVTVAEAPVAAAWTATQLLPADNASAGLPVPEKMVNNFVSGVTIVNGAINVTFGNRAVGALAGKVLTIRPAVVSDAPQVPVTWVCGNAKAPHNMTLMGVNQTTLPPAYLPLECQ